MEDSPKAVLYMLAASFSFAVMALCVKMAHDVSIYDKVLVRNLMTMVLAFVVVRRQGHRLLGALANQPILLARDIFGIIGVAAFFYALNHLLLVDADMLNKLSPFFITLFAFLFLKEKIYKAQILGLFLAFSGALLVIKPRFDLSVAPALVGVASAIGAGAAYTLLRHLKDREAPETIIFHFSLFSVAVALPGTVYGFTGLPDTATLLWLLGVALGATGGQFGVTLAYRYAPASQVSVYLYTTILFSALLGLVVVGEAPDRLSILGGVLIVLAALTSYHSSRRQSRQATRISQKQQG